MSFLYLTVVEGPRFSTSFLYNAFNESDCAYEMSKGLAVMYRNRNELLDQSMNCK